MATTLLFNYLVSHKSVALICLAISLLFPFVGGFAVLAFLIVWGVSKADGTRTKTSSFRRASDAQERWIPPKPKESVIKTRDGIKLKTYVIGAAGPGKRCMLLACPLGQCGLSIYYPLIMEFEDEFTFVTWDYRGLFNSDTPGVNRRLSIHEHAEDAAEVLTSAGFSQADVMVGHSMGVQVSLETALLYPNRIRSLILLNGSHGHVFHTAFQPIFRVPLVGDLSIQIVRYVRRHPQAFAYARSGLRALFQLSSNQYSRLFGNKMMRKILGDQYLADFFEQYLGRILDTGSLNNYLQLFEELNAHSVYHLLETIEAPTLIISGLFDTLTPAYLSFEMAKQIPNSVHFCDKWSSHATLLEHPERVITEVHQFLAKMRK